MNDNNNQGYAAVYIAVAAVLTVTVMVWIVFLMQVGVL